MSATSPGGLIARDKGSFDSARRAGARRLTTSLALLLGLAVATPASGDAQVVGPILEAIRDGGTWVAIPIDEGIGSVETTPIPTMGMWVRGCARVWEGHSGTWQLTAVDHLAEQELSALLAPDESVRFEHRAGPRARLTLDIHWSEPRDTTFLLWVGLAGPGGSEQDACVPPGARDQ